MILLVLHSLHAALHAQTRLLINASLFFRRTTLFSSMAQKTGAKRARDAKPANPARVQSHVQKNRESPSRSEESDSSDNANEDARVDDIVDASDASDDSDGSDSSDAEEEPREPESDPGSESDLSAGSDAEEASLPRKVRSTGDSDFGTALTNILGSRVKAYDAENPVLVRDQRPAKQIAAEREEARARKALRADKLKLKDKARVKEVIPKDPEQAGDALQKEKMLRKIAQRGVVRLLNAIHGAQSAALTGEEDAEVSKEKFLDMIRMG